MGERHNHTQPNMYECIDAGFRFAVLSDIILNNIGKETGTGNIQGPDTAEWPQKPNGYRFKLIKKLVPGVISAIMNVTLEHYIDELPPNQPLTRYSILFSPWQMMPITIVDRTGQTREDDTRQGNDAARQALAILSEAAGREGEEVLERIFDNRFEEIIGRYVLSDLAISAENDPPVPALSSDVAETALVDHLLRDIEICEEAGELSNETDSAAKQSFVAEAILEDPAPRRRGRFKPLDIIKIVKSTATQMASGWKNTVTPDQ